MSPRHRISACRQPCGLTSSPFRMQVPLSAFLYSFLLSFIHPRSWQNNKALDSTLIFIIYSSRTRLHREIIKQNSKLDQDTTNRIELRKNGKGRRCDCDTIPGHLPQAWQLPRGVPTHVIMSPSLLLVKYSWR